MPATSSSAIVATDAFGSQRSLGQIESLFWWAGAQFKSFTLVRTLRLAGQLDTNLLAHSLRDVQNAYALLQAAIVLEPGGKLYYQRQTNPTVNLQLLVRQGDTQWQQVAEELIHQPLATQTKSHGRRVWPSLWRVVAIVGNDHHELILQMHHAICDGLNVSHLFDAILRQYAAHQAAAQGSNSDRPNFSLVPQGLGQRAEQHAGWFARSLATGYFLATEAQKLLKKSTESLPTESTGASPDERRSITCFHTFEEEHTAKLASACQRHGVTIHGALSAAAVATAFEFSAPGAAGLSMQSNIDLRRRHAIPIEPPQLGCYIYWVGTRHRRYPTEDFWARARECRDATARAAKTHGIPPWHFLAMAKPYLAKLATGPRQGRTCTVNVSNLGRFPLATRYGSLTLYGVFGLTAQHGIGAGTTWIAGTLEQRLCLSQIVVSPRHNREQAEAMRQCFCEQLVRAIK